MAEGVSKTAVLKMNNIGDLTDCPICFETYTKPKCLPCLHTFCEHCLQSYINNLLTKDSVPNGFNCPLCRKLVPAPGSVEKVTEWASLMQVNHFMNTLMNNSDKKSETTLCQACQRENETETAISWCKECMEAMCEMCSKYHRRHKSSASHVIVPIDKKSFDEIPIPDHINKCAEHSDKQLELFCTDHDVPCCIVCVTLHHRRCENVDTLATAAEIFRRSSNVDDLLSQLEDNENKVQNAITAHSNTMNNVEKDSDKISADITKIVDDMVEQFITLRKNSLTELSDTKKSVLEKVKTNKEDCENTYSLIQNYRSILTTAKKHGSAIQLFLEHRRIKEQLNDSTSSGIPMPYKNRICFELNDDITKITSLITHLGEVKVNSNKKAKCDLMNAAPVLLRTIKSPKGANFSGVVFLEDGRMLLADRYNPRCMLTDSRGNVQREIQLRWKPFDLCKLTDTEILISPQDQKVLQRLDTTNMTLGTELTVKYPCRSITRTDGVVIASSNSVIHKFDYHGKSDMVIAECQNSWGVCVSDHVIFTEHNNHTMTSITKSGSRRHGYTHSELKYPFGAIGIDIQGNVYVAGCGSNNIHQISVDGKDGRILLRSTDGIHYPWGVHFKRNSNTFVVFDNEGTRLKFYEMK